MTTDSITYLNYRWFTVNCGPLVLEASPRLTVPKSMSISIISQMTRASKDKEGTNGVILTAIILFSFVAMKWNPLKRVSKFSCLIFSLFCVCSELNLTCWWEEQQHSQRSDSKNVLIRILCAHKYKSTEECDGEMSSDLREKQCDLIV